jgi:twitching motility protein PilT
MRDLETIQLAIEAAATGHLVLGTLHTTSATKTVDRIIDVFPANQQEQIRSTVADSLKAVVAQTLFKRVDLKGRCAALEILVCTPACANLIRENKSFQIPSVIQTGRKYGMQSLDNAIEDLLKRGWIAPEEAYSKCVDKSKFVQYLTHKPVDLWE